MSLIARATGGLEIAVLIDTLNNVLLLIPAVVLSSKSHSIAMSARPAPSLPYPWS
jgi:hypothetical protein